MFPSPPFGSLPAAGREIQRGVTQDSRLRENDINNKHPLPWGEGKAPHAARGWAFPLDKKHSPLYFTIRLINLMVKYKICRQIS